MREKPSVFFFHDLIRPQNCRRREGGETKIGTIVDALERERKIIVRSVEREKAGNQAFPIAIS